MTEDNPIALDPATGKPYMRLHVNLNLAAEGALKSSMAREKRNATDVTNRALALYDLLSRHHDEGHKFLILVSGTLRNPGAWHEMMWAE